jgi:transcriptional regulator with XRE-family HTH domain
VRLEREELASAVARRLDSIKARAGIKSREVAQLLNTTPETISRWQNGHAEPQPGRLERLLTLEWLAEELSEFFEPDEARLWLFAPHRLLEGDSPASRIQEGRLQDVLALIEQLKTGAVV